MMGFMDRIDPEMFYKTFDFELPNCTFEELITYFNKMGLSIRSIPLKQ